MRFLFIALLLTCLFSSQAFAHAPYLIKQGTIKNSHNRVLIKEHLYGDGIITNDPVIFQLRSAKGAVLAKSTIGTNITSICPSIKFCIVVPYNNILPYGTGFILDLDSIDFDKAGKDHDFQNNEADEFEKYLTDRKTKRISSYSFGYPQKNTAYTGFKKSLFITIISPLLIIVDQIIVLVSLLLIALLIGRGEHNPSKTNDIKNKYLRHSTFIGISLIKAVFLSGLIIITFVVTNIFFATPMFCIILVWITFSLIRKKWLPKT